MAGKARRAAARQGELGRRRKKGRGPSGAPAIGGRPDEQGPLNSIGGALAMEAAGVATTAASFEEQEQTAPVVAPAPQPAMQSRGRGRQRGERPAAYNYVGTELRRIAALATVVLAALVVISFVV